MNRVVTEIFEQRIVRDASGREHPLESETPLSQCEFLQSIIAEIGASKCLEVGLAYGVSSMFIGEAIKKKEDKRFIVVDPMQSDWHDIGLHNLVRSGYIEFVEFHRDFSFNVLPQLLQAGTEIDFAYIDTTKVFDWVLVDVFFVTRILRVGGVMVLDDCTWPGLRKLARFLSKLPHLTIHGRHFEYKNSIRKKLISTVSRHLPFSHRVLAPETLITDEELGINARCIAFEKTNNDERNWDWSIDF